MKKTFVLLFAVCAWVSAYAVEFTSEKLTETLNEWNAFSKNYPNEIAWAKAVADSGKYSVNDKGDVEYTFIIRASDTLDLNKLKEVTIDYIQYYFKIGNDARANLIQGSTENSVFFQGYLSKYAYLNAGIGLVFYYSSDIIFDIKFKEDRIKFTVRVPDFVYHVGSQRFSLKLQRLDPFMHYKHYKHNERDVDAKAMINLLAKTISYANWYMIYLNHNYKTTETSEEDW
ncbi:MAG: hypothetical protein IKQ11_03525 [Paludibacteraceae bacterium]|nr:hypothetical protein [Paludibacteraceae bacterium]